MDPEVGDLSGISALDWSSSLNLVMTSRGDDRRLPEALKSAAVYRHHGARQASERRESDAGAASEARRLFRRFARAVASFF